MSKAFLVTLIITFPPTAMSADLAPALQWVTTTGGSGNSTVTAAAADASGNFYIVGATTSLDLPTTVGAQQAPGGSTLVRIGRATATASRLFPAGVPPLFFVTADPRIPGTLYAVSRSEVWKTTDAATSWTRAFQFPSTVLVTALAVDPANSSVYAGTSTTGVYKSMDAGTTWTAINNGILPQANGAINITGIWVEPSAPNVVFVSTGSGLARSADAGNSWTLIAGPRFVNVVAFDPSSPGTVYVAGAASLFKSADDGQTFMPLTGLPQQAPINAIAADPHQAGVLFAGSYSGIFQSSDAGVTWVLKAPGTTTLLVVDPDTSAFYGNLSGYGIVKSTDGFTTTSPVGPNEPSVNQLVFSGPDLFEISAPTGDVFAVKLDNNGNVVYSTYFGGSGNDAATALAVGSDGSLYVTGSTTSADLPVTSGAYLTQLPSKTGGASSYVLKLNPDGSRAWSTYFTGPRSVAWSIAVDSAGNPYVGGYSASDHPTTPGAYQTFFRQSETCTGFIGCFPGPSSAFITKFNPQGTGLIYSTYVATDNAKHTVQGAQAMLVDAAGNVWFGVAPNSGLVSSGGAAPSVVELNPAGTAVVASAFQPGLGPVAALALDTSSNVYVAGAYTPTAAGFPATPGAFQSAPQPSVPALPGQGTSGGGQEAFVAKFDSSMTNLLAATLLGGELPDPATSIAVDASATVIVAGYTDSNAFPTRAPFQESFSSRSGFVAGFDANLSHLLFSTYVGDGRPFAARVAVSDGNGNILLAGSTLNPGGPFVGGDNGAAFSTGSLVIANKIALPAALAVRLDSVQNYASHLATPLAPGEPVQLLGAGFANDAQVVLDGSPLPTLSSTATSIMAVLPDTAKTSGAFALQISNAGTLSNAVLVPAMPASPAIYSVDGSGVGQGYILNSDGTMNSPSNPAAVGSAVTIFAAGSGLYTLSNGYAVTDQTPAVFVDGFYCDGIAATIGPVTGLPGNVYRIAVRLPDPAVLVKNNPDLKNFKFPPQVPVKLVMGPSNALNYANSQMVSQNGILINLM